MLALTAPLHTPLSYGRMYIFISLCFYFVWLLFPRGWNSVKKPELDGSSPAA